MNRRLRLGPVYAPNPGAALIPHAWAAIAAAGSLTRGMNVSSITDNGTGDYTVNFAVPFTNSSYGVFAAAITQNFAQPFTHSTAPTASLVRVGFRDASDVATDVDTFVMVVGHN